MDGKSIASAILGPVDQDEPEEMPDDSTEDAAIVATAGLLFEAMESKDRAGVVDAVRALVTMLRSDD